MSRRTHNYILTPERLIRLDQMVMAGDGRFFAQALCAFFVAFLILLS